LRIRDDWLTRWEGPLSAFWRYRVGDYRLPCRIEDDRVVVVVVQIAHRSKVYRKR